MSRPLVLASVVILAGACARDRPAAGGPSGAQATNDAASAPATGTNRPVELPAPLSVSGRIHAVNAALRFVVIDYTLGGMPRVGERVWVYRAEQRVAEVRITPPPGRNGYISGDVLSGQPEVGDEVRPR